MISQSVRLATFRFSIESRVISFLICDLRKVDVDLGREQLTGNVRWKSFSRALGR